MTTTINPSIITPEMDASEVSPKNKLDKRDIFRQIDMISIRYDCRV
ncbi:MAG: hypothetical protein LBF88_01650 [Planctomycetaceae bacterium]|nr:hypothetical protein [Planctomycetaceae bacterium]